jgi:lysozyme
VLINMAFNIGVGGLLKFKNTLAHIRSGQYELAATEMLDSNWARQVHGRAKELALQMRHGTFA